MPRLDYSFLFPDDVCRFARWQYPYWDKDPPVHTHNFHEIFWIEEGEGLHLINGEHRRLFPGLLILIRREDVHGFSAAREGEFMRFANFAFACELWQKLEARHFRTPAKGGRTNKEEAAAWFSEHDHRKREFTLDAVQIERLRMLSHDLEAGVRDALSAEAFLAGVIALLFNARDHRLMLPNWLERACKLIQEQRHFSGGVAEFARLAGRSSEHVARELQRYLKKTPTEIINEARLAFAANQLCMTSREIIDIAADCGLENLGYFYKLFRQRFGVTPHRYRQHAYAVLEPRTADCSGPKAKPRSGSIN